MLGGHSALDPPFTIPNREVKRSSADDSMFSHVKVGHRQASYLYYLFNKIDLKPATYLYEEY